jgi:hypothetical protein
MTDDIPFNRTLNLASGVVANVSGSNFINCAQSIRSQQMQTACSAILSAPR